MGEDKRGVCTDLICSCPDGTPAIGVATQTSVGCPSKGALQCVSCDAQEGRTSSLEINKCEFKCNLGYTKAIDTNDCVKNVCQCPRGTASTGSNCRSNGLSCARCTQYANAVKQPSLQNNCQDEPTCRKGFEYDSSQDSCIVKKIETTAAPVDTTTVAEKIDAGTTAAEVSTSIVTEKADVETTAAPIVTTKAVEKIDTETTAAPIAETTVAEKIEATTN